MLLHLSLISLISCCLVSNALAVEAYIKQLPESVQQALPPNYTPSPQQRFFANLPSGEQVYSPPEQHRIRDFQWVKKERYQLGFTDTFMIRGMVISKRLYKNVKKADIAPYDLVLGWQRMSDPAVLKEIKIQQKNRFYYWQVQEFPIPREEIELSSTNLHLVPDTPKIAKQLAEVKRGDVVSLVGYLTDIKDDDQFIWVTSRSRKDSGDGACEILLIKQMSVIKKAQ